MKKTSLIRFGPLYYAKRYLPNVLRLTAFVGLLAVVGVAFAWSAARAQIAERLMGVGVEMLRYEGAEHQDAPRTMHLNGQAIQVATGVANHSLDRVLDYYESRCMTHDGRFAEQIAELQNDATADPDAASLLDPTMREQDGSKGFVACLDAGTETMDTDSIVSRLERFRRTMDLSAFGNLRYIYAEESGGTTMFVAFWTEGSFRIRDMFPSEGDAPGRDVANVPRPPDARRILSAWEEGYPQSITMYVRSSKNIDRLERYYREAMPDDGWRLLELNEETRVRLQLPEDAQPAHFLIYEQGERMVAIAVGEDDVGLGIATVLTSR